MWSAAPNAAHDALVELERKGALHALVTQNVDGLHHAAGQTPGIVTEIHGNVREAKCMSCGWRGPCPRRSNGYAPVRTTRAACTARAS